MLLFETLKNTFAIYVANFNNYDVVYGSLSAVLLFLLYMFLSFNIVLIGGEVSSVVSKMERGAYEDELRPRGGGTATSLRGRLWRLVKGLFVRQRPVEERTPSRPRLVHPAPPASIQELRREIVRTDPPEHARGDRPGQSSGSGSAATGIAKEN